MSCILAPNARKNLTDYAIAYILLRTQLLLMRISCLTLSLRCLTRVLRAPHAYHGPLHNMNARVLERGSLKKLPDINFKRTPRFSDKPTPSHIVGYILLHPVVATRQKSWNSGNYIEIRKYNLCNILEQISYVLVNPCISHRIHIDSSVMHAGVRCDVNSLQLFFGRQETYLHH